MIKISVISLFRNSEKFLPRLFDKLETLEKKYEMDFYFYENDSTDKTREKLAEWMKERRGQFIYEDINTPVFGHVTDKARMDLMVRYRNTILEAARPLKSEYTLMIDSDVDFSSKIVKDYLPFFKKKTGILSAPVVMCTPFIKQNIKCVMGEPTQLSYFDSFALKDMKGNKGMLLSSNPFWEKEDRELWKEGKPVEVHSAFGGVAMIRSETLNKVKWSTIGGCEHWLFCEEVRRYGKILAVPTVDVYTEVNHWVPDQRLIDVQRKLLSDPWARLAANL